MRGRGTLARTSRYARRIGEQRRVRRLEQPIASPGVTYSSVGVTAACVGNARLANGPYAPLSVVGPDAAQAAALGPSNLMLLASLRPLV